MAYDVAIRITSEADLKALKLSEEATKRLAEEIKKVNGVSVSSAGASGAAQGFDKAAAAFKTLGAESASAAPSLDKINNVLLRGVGTLTGSAAAVGLTAKALALLGPAGTVAATALAVFGGALYVTTSNNRVAREEFDKLSSQLRAGDFNAVNASFENMGGLLKDRAGDFGLLQTAWQRTVGIIKGDVRALNTETLNELKNFSESAAGTLQIRKTQDIVRPIKDQIEQLGAITVPDQIAAAGRQLEIELFSRLRAGGADIQIATDKSQQFAAALQAAQFGQFNRGLQDQIDLLKAANDPLEQIAIRTRNLGSGAQAEALRGLQEMAAKIAVGAPLVASGFAQIGAAAVLPKTKLDELAVSAFALDQKFQAGLISAKQYTEGLKGIASSGLDSTSQTLLKRAGELRTDVGNLAGQAAPNANQFESILGKLQGIKEAAREKFGLDIPPELLSKLSEIESKAKEIAGEKKLTLDASSFTQTLEAANEKSDLLFNTLRVPTQIAADDQVSAKVDSMIDKVRQLRAEASKTINMTIEADIESSPARPFGEWMDSYAPGKFDAFANKANSIRISLPVDAEGSPRMGFSDYFNSYAPGVVDEFSKNAGARGAVNLDSGLASTIMGLHSSIATNLAYINEGRGDPNAGARRNWAAGQIGAAGQTLATIRESLGLEPNNVLGGRRGGAGGGGGLRGDAGPNATGGGGGGNVMNVTLDFRGSTFGGSLADALDDDILPRLEREALRLTGKNIADTTVRT